MPLKPLPFEKLSEQAINAKLQLAKLAKKKAASNAKKSNSLKSQTDQILQKTLKKLQTFIDAPDSKHSISNLTALEHLMHRSILAIHKEKQQIAKKHSEKSARPSSRPRRSRKQK